MSFLNHVSRHSGWWENLLFKLLKMISIQTREKSIDRLFHISYVGLFVCEHCERNINFFFIRNIKMK